MEKRALRTLRQAQLYGHLVARRGRLFHPLGDNSLCDVQTSKEIVRSGWLKYRDGKYVITPEGLRALVAGAENIETTAGDDGTAQK
jgi:hypothetical protein